jgi:hypothetical protein
MNLTIYPNSLFYTLGKDITCTVYLENPNDQDLEIKCSFMGYEYSK